MRHNEKERATIVLAGLGFAFVQLATNPVLLEIVDAMARNGAARGVKFASVGPALNQLSAMAFCAWGMWNAYRALKFAGSDDASTQVRYDRSMRRALTEAAVVMFLCGLFVVLRSTVFLPSTDAGVITPSPPAAAVVN
jgi:hypothetical protein